MSLYWLLPVAYLAGALPFGLWIVKALKGVDIRTLGSGNIGTTNVYRAAGLGVAILVFALDVLKGLLPVLLARYAGALAAFVVVVAFLAVLGHSASIFLRFRGGKSAATGVGTIVGLSWLAGALTLIVWAVLFALTRRVSVGSLGAALTVPIWLYVLKAPGPYVIYGAVAALYVIIRHGSNIRRLIQGEEARL